MAIDSSRAHISRLTHRKHVRGSRKTFFSLPFVRLFAFVEFFFRRLISYSKHKIVLIHKNIFASWSKSFPTQFSRMSNGRMFSATRNLRSNSDGNLGSNFARVKWRLKSAAAFRDRDQIKFNVAELETRKNALIVSGSWFSRSRKKGESNLD